MVIPSLSSFTVSKETFSHIEEVVVLNVEISYLIHDKRVENSVEKISKTLTLN